MIAHKQIEQMTSSWLKHWVCDGHLALFLLFNMYLLTGLFFFLHLKTTGCGGGVAAVL